MSTAGKKKGKIPNHGQKPQVPAAASLREGGHLEWPGEEHFNISPPPPPPWGRPGAQGEWEEPILGPGAWRSASRSGDLSSQVLQLQKLRSPGQPERSGRMDGSRGRTAAMCPPAPPQG